MKEMFLKFAKIIEVNEKIGNIETLSTRNYVSSLSDMLIHMGVDIEYIEPMVDKFIEKNECISEERVRILDFFKDMIYEIIDNIKKG